jgi:hypothetical protein
MQPKIPSQLLIQMDSFAHPVHPPLHLLYPRYITRATIYHPFFAVQVHLPLRHAKRAQHNHSRLEEDFQTGKSSWLIESISAAQPV